MRCIPENEYEKKNIMRNFTDRALTTEPFIGLIHQKIFSFLCFYSQYFFLFNGMIFIFVLYGHTPCEHLWGDIIVCV